MASRGLLGLLAAGKTQKETAIICRVMQRCIRRWVSRVKAEGTPEYCESLARSMPRRIDTVQAAEGYHTKYYKWHRTAPHGA